MKIKIFNPLLIVDILTLLLISAIIFESSSILRILLGVPLLLYFPGYALTAALFVRNKAMNSLETTALSIALSIAIIALIGFGWNYTSWGIKLDTALYSIASFIIVMSIVAFIRRSSLRDAPKLIVETTLKSPAWGFNRFNKFNKFIFILLTISITAAIGILGYTSINANSSEKFTEFYMLGLHSKAQDYPVDFYLDKGQVSSIQYSDETYALKQQWGQINLGIVNYEKRKVTYSIKVEINNELAQFNYDGSLIDELGNIELQNQGIWEHEIGFAPQHIGDNQKVEILLYKDGNDVADYSLDLLINARGTEK